MRLSNTDIDNLSYYIAEDMQENTAFTKPELYSTKDLSKYLDMIIRRFISDYDGKSESSKNYDNFESTRGYEE